MKLVFKKYIFPCLLGIIIYSLLFIFSKSNVNYFSCFLIITILLGLLIRAIDDFVDYEKDKQKSTNLFNKYVLLFLIFSLTILNILLFFISKAFLLIIVLIVFYIELIPQIKFKYLKITYIPLVCFGMSYYYFGINIFSIILSVFCLVIDLYIISKGRD